MGCVALFTGGLKFGWTEAKLQETGKLDWSTEAAKTHTNNISQRRNKSDLEIWTVSSLEFRGHKSPRRHISQEADGPCKTEDPSWKYHQNTGKVTNRGSGVSCVTSGKWLNLSESLVPCAQSRDIKTLSTHFMTWLHRLAPSIVPPPTGSTALDFIIPKRKNPHSDTSQTSVLSRHHSACPHTTYNMYLPFFFNLACPLRK